MRPIRPLLDSAVWKQRTGSTAAGATWSSTTIECGISYVTQRVRIGDQNVIQCSALVTCAEAVQPDDVLTITDPATGVSKDWPVKGLVRVANAINPENPYRVVAL